VKSSLDFGGFLAGNLLSVPTYKEDFTYYETKLRKGKPINQRFRYLMNLFNPKLTVMQFWVKLGDSH
jgi:hypothetical protein